ncbi:response regulator [Sunxiuqinia sp. A32]|uniref:response regulator n=1 Tax=Sunxiuqinia sp. A32 TaxID=3461496 RepID=UPI0040467438
MKNDLDSSSEVLVVDDNPINHRVVLFSLREQFTNIDTAFNGQEAVDKFKKKHYDLILMDLRMPIMNGTEAARSIRNYIKLKGINKDVKIIAMSASDTSEDTRACKEAGMDGYLYKPFRVQELFEVIK